MSYITTEFYLEDYGGIPPLDPESLKKEIKRASETIDMLTGNVLKLKPDYLEKAHPFVKKQVELATASMVEFYIINGGHQSQLLNQMSDVRIGSFNYSMKANLKNIDIPDIVVSHLVPTGLLYAGINTVGGGVYYD